MNFEPKVPKVSHLSPAECASERIWTIWSISAMAIEDIYVGFYRAMLYAERGYATVYVVRLSVRPSVRDVQVGYRDHIGWNSSKIISRPNSLRLLLGLTTTCVI